MPRFKRDKQKSTNAPRGNAIEGNTTQVEERSLFSRTETIAVFFIFAIAILIRSWDLTIKPPHFDEGINGHFVAKMWREGYYHYDPTNFHGPLYFYILQLAEILFGRGLFGFRFITGMLSVGAVVMVAAHRRFFGRAALWAAALLAISPGFVFYARYTIHESLFLLTQVAMSYGFFLWRERRSRQAVGFMTFGLVGAIATKETFFIFVGTGLIGLLCVWIGEKILPARPSQSLVRADLGSKDVATKEDIGSFAIVGIFALLALFSGFFMNPKGILDMFSALAVWTKTGTGNTGHEKSFIYWFDLLRTYEWPFLVALIASPLMFFRSSKEMRLVSVTGFGLWLAYSIVPYKTPWCIFSVVWPLSFVFGKLITRGAKFFKFGRVPMVREIAFIALLATFVHSVNTSLRLNFKDYANLDEPYVYVQTTLEYRQLTDVVDRLIKKRPEAQAMKVLILNKDPWPLPFTFMDYPGLGYGTADSADLTNADMVLTDENDKATIEKRLNGRYLILPFQIRDAYQKGSAYLKASVFSDFVPPGTPLFESKESPAK